ncbi:MAG: FAD-binding protein [Actinobacteria bacterium]|nr:FAD-binding protein [Actinomycetota bacterium]
MSGEVRFDAGSRALYATEASNYRQMPIGVVVPATADDVVAAVEVCRAHGAPLVSRGGGTSLAGQTCNTAVVLDFSKRLNRIVDIDPGSRTARVEPGVVLDDLRTAARAHGLTFGPDPATHNRCTLGGMIGNNSCGVHSMIAGRTADNVHELDVLTYDGLRTRVGRVDDADLDAACDAPGRRGDIHRRLRRLRDETGDEVRRRFPDIPRRVSGYGLEQLLPEHGFHVARSLVGSEATCVTVLEATVALVPDPRHRALLVLGYPDIYAAADDVPDLFGFAPIGLEGLDEMLVEDMELKGLHDKDVDLLPEGRGWLLVEFGGDSPAEAADKARQAGRRLDARPGRWPRTKVLDDPQAQHRMWVVRESGLASTARVPGQGDTWPGWEDAAVHPDRLGEYLRRLRALYAEYGYNASLYGHFGQGCVHTRIDFDLLSTPGIEKYRAFVDEAADLVVDLGGSLSGEHGDGQARGELLPKLYGERIVDAFRQFKAIWDPQGKMNPGKVVDANRITDDLRLGADYDPPATRTYFRFPDDAGDFATATQRCVGVGECRKRDSGVMCPSFMVTEEEEHSTRGRAHLLFELLSGRGEVGGWRDAHVKDALDLCLACKGCKGECPVQVDVATYKAEFLAHYWRHRLRPRTAYSMGLVMYWARAASIAPRAANAVLAVPHVERTLKRVGGVHAERRVPRLATEPFTPWFGRRSAPPSRGRRVVLWPDTFTESFHPSAGHAAVEVLEAAGFDVALPTRRLCCGRPLYDYGWLGHARRLLRRTLRVLEDDIRAGTPVVGLEPSCVSVLRDELGNLLPHDRDGQRLRRQTYLLSEFLDEQGVQLPVGSLDADALVQLHCHQRSVLSTGSEQRLLDQAGVRPDVLDAGCCGMAGSFGFEDDDTKYAVSVACGERALLPAVRAASPDTLLVADGFSCREQIDQTTGRRALHTAEVLAQALHRQRKET